MSSDTPTPELLFHQAIALMPEERAAFLSAACRGHGPLRRRVENLLEAHEKAGGFLGIEVGADPDRGQWETAGPGEGEGSMIGRYKLLQKIGEGGFGAVYMAEQREPVKRRVALKIIKLGMDTKQVVARFEAERQALALLDHPSIAKVLDAGSTETGRPFFVMELVKGVPITDYCDQEHFATRARLELLTRVCHAVQHAHQKGIIHRDLKPSNIMVTLHDGVPVPKVIDFGVAKATQHELTEKTIFTLYSQLIGTPAYMSPEQAEMSGLDIDTRSDIYSLGVLLYELLTGKTPLDSRELVSGGYQEIRRRIREVEPLKPSTRVSTLHADERAVIAKRRQSDPLGLSHLLRGDLDWVVMKCLEKDRTRRYETSHELAADLTRHLNTEPVMARPPSVGYKAAKFVRRNKTAVLGAAIAAAALVVGGAVAAWQAVRAEAALAAARHSQAELAFDKGQFLGEQGDANEALLWLAHSLQLAPPDAEDLRLAIRRGISGWMSRTFPLEQVFPHPEMVSAVSMSKDHSTLFTLMETGNQGFVLRVWDVASGEEITGPFSHLRGDVSASRFSGDGSMLAVGYRNGAIEVMDTSLPSVPGRSLPPVEGPVTTMEFSPDHSLLLVANLPAKTAELPAPDEHLLAGPGTVRVIDVASGEMILPSPLQHDRGVWAAAFSSDSAIFVTETGDWADTRNQGQTRFWNLEGVQIREPVDHPGSALGVAVSPDNTKLATGHWDLKARLWDLTKKDQVAQLGSFPGYGPARFVEFHPVLTNVLSVTSFSGDAQLWDLSGKPLTPPLWHDDLSRSSSFPDGEWILTGGLGGVRAWKARIESPKPDRFRPEMFPLAFSEDRRLLLIQDLAGTISVREALTGRRVGGAIDSEPVQLTGAISSNTDLAATIGPDKRVRLWDMAQGQRLAILDPPQSLAAYSAAFSPDGTTLATGHFGVTVVLWETTAPFREKARWVAHPQHTGPLFTVRYSPDGKSLLTGSLGTSARLWNTETGALWKELGEVKSVMAADFNREGTMLVTVEENQAARLWDLARDEEVAAPLRHHRNATAAQFSPDGALLLTGSADGTARLWDVATGKQIGPSQTHSNGVFAVMFWPDDQTIAVGVGDENHVAPDATRAVYWPLPEGPLEGTEEEIQLRMEVITGLELIESGSPQVLSIESWIDRRDRLRETEKRSGSRILR